MINKNFAFPYDPYGTNPDCKVLQERHTITPLNGTNAGFIIPKAAPFFRKSVKLKHVASGRELIDGLDWSPGYHFEAASSAKPYMEIFGAIVILDSTLSGTIEIVEYQTIGGEFTLDETTLLELLANTQLDPRATTWDKISYRPLVYDAANHLFSAEDTYGYSDMVAELRLMRETFSVEYSKLAIALANHAADSSNPHEVTSASVALERFDLVYRASLQQVIDGHESYYVVGSTLKAYVANVLGNLSMHGDNGEVPFFTAATGNFNVIPGRIQNKMGIVHNAAEWTAQVGARESFADVFNNWRRIAMSGNNPVAAPAELNGWSYNPATDSVASTINSGTLIGLISPETVSGDYVFEVEVKSNNSDDDMIGICLGLYEYNNKLVPLCLIRTCSNQTTSATSRPSLSLGVNYAQPGGVTLAQIVNLNAQPGGWAGMTGIVKVRARRVGTMVYVTTTEPDGPYLPEVSFDLATRDDTRPATGAVNLGYVSYSQAGASWKTLQRTGAQAPVVGLHDGKVAEWDGAGYVVGTKKAADVIKSGRYYRNYLTKRTYFAEADGVVSLASGSGATLDVTEPTALVGRVVGVSNANTSYMGGKVEQYNTAGDGTITYLGYIEKLATGMLNVVSRGNPAKVGMSFADAGGGRGGIAFVASGSKIGFEDNAGVLRAYVNGNSEWHITDATGVSLGAMKAQAAASGNSGRLGFARPDGKYGAYLTDANHWAICDTAGTPIGAVFIMDGKFGFKRADGTSVGYVDNQGHVKLLDPTGNVRGGVAANATGHVGLTKVDGSFYGYFDNTGKFNHWGMNHLSDRNLKIGIEDKAWVDDSELVAKSWIWSSAAAVADTHRGRADEGVIAQAVLECYPSCVSRNAETGLYSVDYAKLGVLMFLNERIKPNVFIRLYLKLRKALK